jgi:hypothetical protein
MEGSELLGTEGGNEKDKCKSEENCGKQYDSDNSETAGLFSAAPFSHDGV